MNARTDMNSVSATVRSVTRLLLGAALCFAALAAAHAQESYPTRPLKFVAPIAPGGLTDTLARTLAAGLSQRLGQQVVVENRAGGGGIIGMTAAAKLPADGYGIVMVYQGVASVNPVLYKNLAYDTLRDFVPVAQVATFPLVLVVNPALPAKSVKEFVALARSRPGRLSYASAGNATTAHLTMELFKRREGLRIVHIPYRGEAPALTDVMSGQVDAAFTSLTSALPYLGTDRIRMLGIASAERSRLLPNVPTIAEDGVPGFESTGWYGILAPAGTPKLVIDRLNRELLATLADPAVKEMLAARGVDVGGGSPEALRQWIVEDTARWRKVIADAGIQAD
jgi:tripartite-type tricarboxylate transporter receptor subunit TctC